jgi:sugar phosphate permease
MNAMSTNTLLNQPERIGAPAIAGLLIAAFGTPLTYAINAGFMLVNAIAMSFIRTDMRPEPTGQSPARDLLQGLGFIRRHSIILVVLGLDAAANLVGSFIVLYPIISDQFGMGAVGVGLLGTAQAVGRLTASLALMTVGDFPRKGTFITFCLLGYAALLVGLGLAPSFVLTLIVVAGLGTTDGLQAQTRNVLVQMLTPNPLRGRVSSFAVVMQNGSPALGHGVLGAAAAAAGAPLALIAAGVVCALSILGISLTRKDLHEPGLGHTQFDMPSNSPTAAASPARSS